MDIFSILLIAVGLSMDAAAVSIAKGLCLSKENIRRYALLLALFFGLFQGLMPLIGYLLGSYFANYIYQLDHWIAFILLCIIGAVMIKESFDEQDDTCENIISFKDIIVLAVATSIDALAVGVSLAFLQVNIFQVSIIITLVTFCICLFCVFMGKKLGNYMRKYAEIFGGSILILIGFKILIEHLFLS